MARLTPVSCTRSERDMLKALRLFDNFAWTAVTADCEASRKELNRRIAVCRATINTVLGRLQKNKAA